MPEKETAAARRARFAYLNTLPLQGATRKRWFRGQYLEMAFVGLFRDGDGNTWEAWRSTTNDLCSWLLLVPVHYPPRFTCLTLKSKQRRAHAYIYAPQGYLYGRILEQYRRVPRIP